MAYLFAAATTDVIACGTGVTKATTFSAFLRFAPTAVENLNDRRLLFLERRSDGHRNFGIALNTGSIDNELAGSFREAAGPSFPSITWESGFGAATVHTLVLTYNGTAFNLYADTDATAKATLATSTTPDTESDLLFSIGNINTLSLSSGSTIYEVGWWPGTVLTGAQASAIGAGTPPAGNPANYWPLIDNALDLFGGAHGTVTGATVVAHSGTNLYAAAAAPTRRNLTLLGVS